VGLAANGTLNAARAAQRDKRATAEAALIEANVLLERALGAFTARLGPWHPIAIQAKDAARSLRDVSWLDDTKFLALDGAAATPPPPLQEKLARAARRREQRADPVASAAAWEAIWDHADVALERLACFAYFWNVCTPAERHRALAMAEGEAAACSAEMMTALPTENYELNGILPVRSWVGYFSALATEAKIGVLAHMWATTAEEEKAVIVRSLKEYLDPVRSHPDWWVS